MSSVVRLKVPPFESTAPTSLAALHRPLIQAETTVCDAHCSPCPACVSAQAKKVEKARALASDLGLRLSQLVEDAMREHVARIEAEQAQLVASVLKGVLPHLADATLRSTLALEIAHITKTLGDRPLKLAKNPELDLGSLPEGSRLTVEDDPTVSMHQVQLRDREGLTLIDPDAIIQACLDRLSSISPTAPALSEAQE